MDCGATCSKYLLFIFNFVFFLSGIAVLTVGSYIKANEEDFYSLIGTNLFSICILLIVVGILVTIIGFFGCCGAIRESKCMLYTYSGLLCLIFVMEFAAGIAAFVYRDELTDMTATNLNSSMFSYIDNQDVQNQWDNMQRTLGCCGVEKASDWLYPLSGKAPKDAVPMSCCNTTQTPPCSTSGGNPNYTPNNQHVYTLGCVDAANEKIDDYAVIIGGVAIGIAFIQILGIIFACCLASAIKD